jgi:Carboxypeptidase regulatory-like domain
LIDISHEATRRARVASAMLCACALALVAARARAQGIGTGTGSPPAPSSSSAAGAARGRGSITVRVLDDSNQPVQNASVSVFPQGRQQFTPPNYDNSGGRSGRYVLTDLDAGLYSLFVNVPGYVMEPRPAPADSDSTNANNPPVLYRPGDSVTVRVVKGGVITGRVTDADGNPVVGAHVNVASVRTLEGQPLLGSPSRERRTDDRGVYRLYGLGPGVYLVFAGGRSQNGGSLNRLTPFDGELPTYYPSSSSREGAVEVQVQTGQEMTDIDIRYRGDKGHSVSGTIAGLPASARQAETGGTLVTLRYAATGALAARTFVAPDSQTHAFSLDAVADGEYELDASVNSAGGDGLAATPLHVSVHGADVAGQRLTLAALGSLAGRVAFEPLKAADAARAECKSARPFAPQELLVSTGPVDTPARQQRPLPQTFSSAAPDDKGDFHLHNLREGRYRLGVQLVDAYYLRAVALPASAPASATAGTTANTTASAATGAGASNARGATTTSAAGDLGQGIFRLRPGENLAGALLSISAGAASLRGRVAAGEGGALPEGLRVFIVPSERERAADALRYGETAVRPDGTFAFRNLAPGGYLLLARPAPEADPRQPRLPFALDAAARAAIRRDAEAASNSVTLQPCQRNEDFTLRLPRQ